MRSESGRWKSLLSEYGPDLSRFPTEDEFISHVNLAPLKPVTGGKPLKKKQRGSASTRTAGALRMAAVSHAQQQDRPGRVLPSGGAPDRWRRCGIRHSKKVAQLIYRLLRWGQPYVDEESAESFEKRYTQQRLQRLKASANNLGCELTPKTA